LVVVASHDHTTQCPAAKFTCYKQRLSETV
jgi:hypothetical protein